MSPRVSPHCIKGEEKKRRLVYANARKVCLALRSSLQLHRWSSHLQGQGGDSTTYSPSINA